MLLPRRTFLASLGAALCTPAVVRAGALMPIRALQLPEVNLRMLTEYIPGDYGKQILFYDLVQEYAAVEILSEGWPRIEWISLAEMAVRYPLVSP